MSNTPEKDFHIRNNFVEDKNARSNKVNFMNFNIPISNGFDNLRSVENTQNDAKIDDVIEIDVAETRQSPFVKSSKCTVKQITDVVINTYPEKQLIFGKENINAKLRQETYNDVVHGNVKKDTRKIITFTDSILRSIWMCKFNQCTDGVGRLKRFPGPKSKKLAHYVVPTLKEESFHTGLIHVGVNDILRNQSEIKQQLILQNIMNIAHQCKGHGVKKIILSSVVATGRVNADVLIYFNQLLKNPCRANGICFVNNNNISEGNLNKDSLHLLEAGKRILDNNFINGLDHFNGLFLFSRERGIIFLKRHEQGYSFHKLHQSSNFKERQIKLSTKPSYRLP